MRSRWYPISSSPPNRGKSSFRFLLASHHPLINLNINISFTSQGSTEAPIRADQVIPVLLLTEDELNGTPDQIGQLLQYYVDTDDVCSPSFTDILVEKPSRQSGSGSTPPFFDRRDSTAVSGRATYRLKGRSVAGGRLSGLNNSKAEGGDADGDADGDENDPKDGDENDNPLPSGPYFLSGPNLHRAYRLYPDTQDAFVYGMIPNDVYNPTTSGFKAVSFLSAKDSMSKTIPVPSRHYYTRFPPQNQKKSSSLWGKRITLTDGLEVSGTQTTLSCHAYVSTYPPSDTTDAYVQRLLQEGAVLVAKTKTSQLRISNSLWPETHFPANPRAARRGNIFEVRGSGIGSASAVAGYEWLEYAVGGNVDSAVRESGRRYGVYGLRVRRPLDSGTLENMKLTGEQDGGCVVGIFGRSLRELGVIAESTFSSLDEARQEAIGDKKVKRIVYPDYGKDEKLEYAMDVFVEALERHLGVERTTVKLDEEWEKYRVKNGFDWSLSKVWSNKHFFFPISFPYPVHIHA